MTNEQVVELVAQQHDYWVDCVARIGNNKPKIKNYAEDFVQEMYIKLLRQENLSQKAIKVDGELSTGYVFTTLKNLVIDNSRKRGLDLIYAHSSNDFEETFDAIFEEIDPEHFGEVALTKKMWSELKKNLHWFDVRILTIYLLTGKTYKQIAAETGIAYQTIFLAVKRCKQFLTENFEEDYQDFINGDFDKI